MVAILLALMLISPYPLIVYGVVVILLIVSRIKRYASQLELKNSRLKCATIKVINRRGRDIHVVLKPNCSNEAYASCGYIVVSSDLANNNGVIEHEVGHIMYNHYNIRSVLAVLKPMTVATVALICAISALPLLLSAVLITLSTLAVITLELYYSRVRERQADGWLATHFTDPNELVVNSHALIRSLSADDAVPRPMFGLLNTHPSNQQRRTAMLAAVCRAIP